MVKGYGIFSGGLDSILSAKVLQNQGIDVRLLTFTTPFFNADHAMDTSRILGIKPRIIDITEAHLQMMQQPKHGFGRFANPCIDCHALMFKTAGEIMVLESGDFLFSGEVLGQRPKSQNRRALQIVARESGFSDFIIRPLSAQTLPPTKIEEDGLVDRKQLLGFSGRTRKPQMALADAYGITNYPSPAGGCLLTDPIFSRRIKELMAHDDTLEASRAELLKWGRHFRLPGGTKLVVGRNQAENEIIEKMVRPGDLLLKAAGVPGPTVLASGGRSEDLELAAVITVSYSDAPVQHTLGVRLIQNHQENIMEAQGVEKNEFSHLMV